MSTLASKHRARFLDPQWLLTGTFYLAAFSMAGPEYPNPATYYPVDYDSRKIGAYGYEITTSLPQVPMSYPYDDLYDIGLYAAQDPLSCINYWTFSPALVTGGSDLLIEFPESNNFPGQFLLFAAT